MTEVNTEKLIAESENISRNDRSTSRHQDTSGIQYGEEAVATPTAVIFRWGSEGGYAQGALVVPWPAVLEHAPTAELVAALHNRRDVDWGDVLECTPVEEMEREIKNRDADAKAWAMEH